MALAAWAVAWIVGAVDIFRRRDLGVGGKVLWLVVLLVLPIIGLLVYYLFAAAAPRPTDGGFGSREAGSRATVPAVQRVQSEFRSAFRLPTRS